MPRKQWVRGAFPIPGQGALERATTRGPKTRIRSPRHTRHFGGGGQSSVWRLTKDWLQMVEPIPRGRYAGSGGPLTGPELSPMLPDRSVTYLPGCSNPGREGRDQERSGANRARPRARGSVAFRRAMPQSHGNASIPREPTRRNEPRCGSEAPPTRPTPRCTSGPCSTRTRR